MKLHKSISVLFCIAYLASCAGREAQRIAVVQEGDFARSCDSLQLEASSIDSQIKSLIVENSRKQGNNAAAVIGGLLFLPALFALDLKGAAKAEYEALLERNKHLSNVAASQNCEPAIVVKTLDEYKQEIAAERKANGTASGVDQVNNSPS